MKASDQAYSLIKSSERLYLKAYKCPAGIWTIGWGHTKGVKSGDVITEVTAFDFLKQDVADVENQINKIGLKINQNQFDALVDFVFNLGIGSFLSSSLLKKIKNNANDSSIRSEFEKWVYGGGHILPGLVIRRQKDASLYFK